MTPSGSLAGRALAFALWAFASTVQASTPEQPDAAMLLREIERLSVVGNVLYVAAHPDDENTRLLAWLVDSAKVRAAYLSLTRGEGGQNLIGAEQSPLLGVIRTQELLAARRLDRAEQLFGRQRDFGYSKTPEETLAIWGKEDALADVVWAIRRFRPDVIVTRFSPQDRETHGHHSASAMLAVEAFQAAADPKAFPEQLRFTSVWKARRLVWNRGVWGQPKPEELAGFLKLDIGGYDALLGRSAGELAARSRSMHKSQGFGASPQRGPVVEYFKVLAGEPMQRGLLDGVELTWGRVKGTTWLRELLAQARTKFDPRDPSASVPVLLRARAALDALPDNPWKAEKRQAIDSVIAACSGLFLDAVAAEASAVPGEPVKLVVTALQRSTVPLRLQSVRIAGETTGADQVLACNGPWTLEKTIELPRDTPPSNPYWLTEEPTPGRWQVRDAALRGLPEAAPALQVSFALKAGNDLLELVRPVTFAWTDPVAGEKRRPLEVLPPVTANPAERLMMFPDGAAKELRVVLRASRGAAEGALRAVVPDGFIVEPAGQPFSLPAAAAEQEVVFRVMPPARVDEGASREARLEFALELRGQPSTVTAREAVRLDYPHISMQTVVPATRVKLVRFAMKRALTRVGYVPGAGDEVAAALHQVGYQVTVLSDEALAREPLERFEAIVVGVRAFNTNPRMAEFRPRLMDYVARGGMLLVQYSTKNRISKLEAEVGPFPFVISQDRVTDETAPVERLAPDDRFFKTPNLLQDGDFAGWVQERGIYFAGSWDPRYRPLLSMHDPGEPPRQGSVLVARHGKGTFVYTGLSFFRQLPAGVPGAFRIFANLLAHDR